MNPINLFAQQSSVAQTNILVYRYLMRKFINFFSPNSYIGDFGLCLFLALLIYILGFLFVFLSEISSGVTGAGIFTVYYVVLFPVFLIPAAFLLFIFLATIRFYKKKKNGSN